MVFRRVNDSITNRLGLVEEGKLMKVVEAATYVAVKGFIEFYVRPAVFVVGSFQRPYLSLRRSSKKQKVDNPDFRYESV